MAPFKASIQDVPPPPPPPHPQVRRGCTSTPLTCYACLKPAPNNMWSAHDHPSVVSEYLAEETALGRMLGPFNRSTCLCPLQINRFGVIPKGHDQGKWRLITDLSFPPGHSVNDGIDPTLCSLLYSTVDEVADLVARFGPGSLLPKIDIQSAYWLIPVHPHDRPLLGMQWERSPCTLTRCSRSASDQHRRYLTQWLMHSHRTRHSVGSYWPSWTANARHWVCQSRITNGTVQLPALHSWGLRWTRSQASFGCQLSSCNACGPSFPGGRARSKSRNLS